MKKRFPLLGVCCLTSAALLAGCNLATNQATTEGWMMATLYAALSIFFFVIRY